MEATANISKAQLENESQKIKVERMREKKIKKKLFFWHYICGLACLDPGSPFHCFYS